MKLGYVISYVDDVEITMAFYEKAFQLAPAFLHESKTYGELDTGFTKLAFCSKELAKSNGVDFVENSLDTQPPGIEIALVCDDVESAFKLACDAGAVSVKNPSKKPWGQTVAYVRDINGVLVELCTPVGS